MSTMAARAPEPATDYAEQVLDEVRRKIQVEQRVIDEARERRDLVKDIVEAYHGVRRTYNAGSIAHGTAKNPLPDADCGGVLDRRSYPQLGPDGGGEGPNQLIADVADFVMDEVRAQYPDAECEITKRAIQITFNEPIDKEDPSVDLIAALTRADEPGLWIPNTKKDDWDASDPEEHTRLLTARPKELRVHRARLIRLRDFRRHAEGLAEQQTFGEHGLELTGRVFAAWRAYQHEHHDRSRLQADIAPIQADLRALLEDAGRKSKRTRLHRRLANNLLKVWPALWTFTTHAGVEPTNNPAERALRGPVIHRKLSHGTRSDDGERFAERALSAAATCRQQSARCSTT
jgi:Transposase IS66 family